MSYFYDIKKTLKGLVAVVFSFGLLSTLLIPFGLYTIFKAKLYKEHIVVTSLIVPNVTFWLLTSTF